MNLSTAGEPTAEPQARDLNAARSTSGVKPIPAGLCRAHLAPTGECPTCDGVATRTGTLVVDDFIKFNDGLGQVYQVKEIQGDWVSVLGCSDLIRTAIKINSRWRKCDQPKPAQAVRDKSHDKHVAEFSRYLKSPGAMHSPEAALWKSRRVTAQEMASIFGVSVDEVTAGVE